MLFYYYFLCLKVVYVILLASSGKAYQTLSGVRAARLKSKIPADAETEVVNIDQWLSSGGRRLLVFGTYAADFNAIEYGQRLRYYWPKLQQMEDGGLDACALLLNCQPTAAQVLRELVDLPDSIEVWVDNTGSAGRQFGVGRGWLPDNNTVNPFIKLFGMLWGLGAWATLPAVIGGYLGNPFHAQPWIENALAVGQRQGRWPNNALVLDKYGAIERNKFSELHLFGSWKRRPLELATLRLQSMLGISLSHWQELAPNQEALDAGVLTQLGGCIIVEENETIYEWRDPGICAVANFEDIVRELSKTETKVSQIH